MIWPTLLAVSGPNGPPPRNEKKRRSEEKCPFDKVRIFPIPRLVPPWGCYHGVIRLQVSVVHVSATSKNAADEKLKTYVRKFAHSQRAPGTVVLISGRLFIQGPLYNTLTSYNNDQKRSCWGVTSPVVEVVPLSSASSPA